MTTQTEELKLALEALKGYRRELNDGQPCDAEQYIEKLLAQPEQEPVAEIVSDAVGCLSTKWRDDWTPNEGDKLYTTTPQRTWVGLTDDEFMYFCSYVRADVLSEIETKLKELNT